jgi:anti-sigma-K factor RskA
VAIASSIVVALAGVIGKLWSDQKTELRELRAELASANQRIVELQREEHGEHVRDLRRFAGLSTSMEPPAAWPPPVVRAKRR